MEGTIGEVRLFGGNFAPRFWAFCQGQLLSISQNQSLYSIIGTTYGGDGRTTFALPDLRGRTALSDGTGPGLITRVLGARGGEETVTLGIPQIPPHTHLTAFPGAVVRPKISIAVTANSSTPENAYPADAGSGNDNYRDAASSSTEPMAKAVSLSFNSDVTIGAVGGSQPHTNLQPFLALNYIICTVGDYPSRS